MRTSFYGYSSNHGTRNAGWFCLWICLLTLILTACGSPSGPEGVRTVPPPPNWRVLPSTTTGEIGDLAPALAGERMPDRIEVVRLEADPALQGDVTLLLYSGQERREVLIFDRWSGIEGHSLTDGKQLGRATYQSTADPALWQLYWHRCNVVVRVRFPSTIDSQEAYDYSRRIDAVLARTNDC